ncbi:MAG: AAA family ATPase, partial [Burkholderiales bacterium]
MSKKPFKHHHPSAASGNAVAFATAADITSSNAPAPSAQIALPGYTVHELLHRGSTRAVYRGIRVKDHLPVVIKTLLDNFPSAADSAALRREYETLSAIKTEGVIQAYALEPYGESMALILEDIGGAPLKTGLSSVATDLSTFLDLALQLASALGELHRANLMHKDINPRNIIVNPQSRQLKLTGFGEAFSRAGKDGAHLSAAMLPYMSPEQTGRVSRTLDYRTDFYSLGVCFYEMLTGSSPFRSDDALELIHSHIAKTPPAPAIVNPQIPEPVSNIVMKLMAKTAEERYQSAAGLRQDLAICAREWAVHRRIAAFPLAQRDVADHFLIPQKLYGREREVDEMLMAFNRVCQAGKPAPSLLLVSGYSGIGKTALIQELYRPIVRQKGYFISGKFDQIVRNIPFGALIQAFRALVRQLLTESEKQLAARRDALTRALGANGGVLAEVIPEIEFIIGKQPPPVALGSTEALNRFQRVLQNFIAAIARPQHPLVVFLDDLQWADTATLSLLEPLLAGGEIQSLLLLGAYRDNEVDAAHPLLRTLAALEAAGIRLQRVELGPLRLPDLTQLVRDALHGGMNDALPLAQLVQDKTGGNPFFVTQFLKTLEQEGYFKFDDAQGRWTYRIEAIAGAPLTDNVVDLMTRKIQRLSVRTQRALTLAACIGNPFDPHLLAIVSEQSPQTAADDLGEAINEGLILPVQHHYGGAESWNSETASPAYSFLHDRVQQSAYALIPDEHKQSVHLTVGRLLRSLMDLKQADTRLFDLVHHLNLGGSLITDTAERLAVARLNLSAGQKAKSSTAHKAALDYLQTGLSLLDETCWQSDYELAFALHLEAAESQYLCGDFAAAERHFEWLLPKANTLLDKGQVYKLWILGYESLSRYADAIRIGHQGLALFGVSFPALDRQREQALESEISAIQSLLGERSIAALIDMPVMRHPETRMVMQLLANLHTPCYLSGNKILTLLNTTAMVRLSLAHGNIEESAYAYVLHAMNVGPIRKDYEAAYEFGMLALRLSERFNNPGLRARALMNFAWNVSLWRKPLQDSLPLSREAFRLGNDSGLFVDAAYALFNECWLTLLTAHNLDTLQTACAPNVEYTRRVKMEHFAIGAPQVILQWGRALQGLTENPCSLTDANFDEDKFRRDYRQESIFQMFYLDTKLALLYTFGEYRAACEVAAKARRIIRDYTGIIWDQIRVYYHALALAALPAGVEERKQTVKKLAALNKQLKQCAENSPQNFLPQHLIVSAEIARLKGKVAEAILLYEAAIEAGAKQECPRERALANELYARFRLQRGETKLAALFMAEARACYAQWGAAAKVAELERRYSELLIRKTERRARAASKDMAAAAGTDTGTLDLFSVMKAAQAIAGEIELEQLLAKLMRIVIENAGAESGSLLLEHDGASLVYAEGAPDSISVKVGGIPLAEARSLPASIINYVRRTAQSVVIADAQSDDQYGVDPHIARHKSRSVLCVPVLNQGRPTGILYLENNQVGGAFTPERIQIIRMLSAQAAIALENAKLFDGLKQEIAERKRAEEQVREQAMLLDKAHDAIGVRDLDDRVIYWNKGAQQLFGWSAEEILGQHAPGILYPDPAQCDEPARKVRESGNWSGEMRMRTKSGAEVMVGSRWTLVRGDDGQAKSILVISTDITEKKRMEGNMLRAQRMESIGTLAGGIAHDLNNLLAPIMLAVDTLKLKPDYERRPQLLEMIEANAKRGAEMANQVLSFARGVEGKRVTLNPRHLIREIEKIARETFPRSIEMQTKFTRGLYMVSGDATQMHQVLLNLVLNARDAMPNGGVLKIGAENLMLDESYARMHADARPGPYVVITVADSGSGIAPELQERIFEPFFTTKEIGRGTGLGLSTAVGIVKGHGGFFTVYSEPGKGSKFKVYLPALQSSAAREAEEKRELPAGNGELILVIDDEGAIREVTKTTLEAHGYQVLTAGDGTEALALYAKRNDAIKVVLTDLMMPYMDGAATVRALEKMNPQVKIILSSGMPANTG